MLLKLLLSTWFSILNKITAATVVYTMSKAWMCHLLTEVLRFSFRNEFTPHTAVLNHFLTERVWKSAHHRGVGGEQANEDGHQLISALPGHQWPHDGHFLHALHSDPQHFGRFHLWSSHVQDCGISYGYDWFHYFTITVESSGFRICTLSKRNWWLYQ